MSTTRDYLALGVVALAWAVVTISVMKDMAYDQAHSSGPTPITEQDVALLRAAAEVLGDASACGYTVEHESQRVGRWMDKRFSPKERATHLPEFTQIMYDAAHRRAKVRQESADDQPACWQTLKSVQTFPWP
jgi:hypothetical protein